MTGQGRVRPATEADLERVVPLFDAYRRFYRTHSDLEGARTFLAERLTHGESVVFLATFKTRLAIGFAQLYPSFSSVALAPIVILNDLFVDPSARRQGVARALIDAAAAHARGAGAVRLELATARDNTAALRVYRSYGFEPDSAFTHLSLALA